MITADDLDAAVDRVVTAFRPATNRHQLDDREPHTDRRWRGTPPGE